MAGSRSRSPERAVYAAAAWVALAVAATVPLGFALSAVTGNGAFMLFAQLAGYPGYVVGYVIVMAVLGPDDGDLSVLAQLVPAVVVAITGAAPWVAVAAVAFLRCRATGSAGSPSPV